MSGTPPPPGSVIRYAYLWADEFASGREEGRKDRPSLVLALAVQVQEGVTEVLVVAITHSAPWAPEDAVAIPDEEKQRLGLDDLPSWIVTAEGNAFILAWPGYSPVARARGWAIGLWPDLRESAAAGGAFVPRKPPARHWPARRQNKLAKST